MSDTTQTNVNNAYVGVRHADASDAPYTFGLSGSLELYSGIKEGSWIVVLHADGALDGVGRVFRVRSEIAGSCIYFDKYLAVDSNASGSNPFTPPGKGQISRLEWSNFAENIATAFNKTLADVPLIDDEVYVRDLLQIAVVDDLLGPANGPLEQIVDMSVRDRYLVGRLAPIDAEDKTGGLGVDGSGDDNEDPDDLRVKSKADGKFAEGSERIDDPESSEEVDTTNNQSIIPSSFGITFCIAGDVEEITVHPSWGRYERFHDHERYKISKDPETGEEKQGQKLKIWQRIPCGKPQTILVKTGPVAPITADNENEGVVLQGSIREENDKGDRLVTLFLVNTQEEPPENRDTAWVFQPEIRVTAGNEKQPIFRRRPIFNVSELDDERRALDMIYRNQVEFAVGHGVAVHATVSTENVELATEIKTVVIPEYEVPVTEVPGLREQDRPALKELVQGGLLDMAKLAEMDRDDLVAALTLMTDDYTAWIEDQTARIGADVVGHDAAAHRAMERCTEINRRLKEGIAVLANTDDENALKAFRFANQAMARQRIHSIFASKRRKGEEASLEALDIPKNRSWRSFQLAFLLLSVPALANPEHADRTNPAEAFADLLWFPTGGGKTEAYLGVAAFTLAIRRYQGNLGGYDSSRGLSVIMRYTLRLLTLQQFQRATALICAMEVIRRESLANGDDSLGNSPFTIGLWVGNRVTPGSTDQSNIAITNARNPDRNSSGSSSPAQLTSCPWCGSDIDPAKHIEVNVAFNRTTIYCGDNRGRCDFSKGKSARLAQPGLPAVVVDDEIYHRPPSMMIATVDKFAMMAWRGQTRTLFGKASLECERHGLLWPDGDCKGNHNKDKNGPSVKAKVISNIRPPDLIIQDEFHLISGPLGTMVGLYETAVDELCSWKLNDSVIRPKIIASTATVRKAREQVNGIFNRQVAIFPPHGLDASDNFFSVQRSIEDHYGRRYLGVCSPGSARPAVLIRVYTALLTASAALFERFGQVADPYMTAVGYFNSLRELGGMKRLAEDDVQTRSYRVQMSEVSRPGLAQRSVSNIKELTSRVSSQEIPKYLDQLEVPFKAELDPDSGKWVSRWQDGDTRAIDVVLATNMLSVGVDVNRLGVMAVNGQPKTTAEYIQATSRVGRSFPGLVCSVLTWSRPRDLSHYETFEHYHATFYQHVEAQSVTPYSPRAIDRGLTGSMLALMRLDDDELNPNDGAEAMKTASQASAQHAKAVFADRVLMVEESNEAKDYVAQSAQGRLETWVKQTGMAGRTIAYEKRGQNVDSKKGMLIKPGIKAWEDFTVPMSMREVEPGVKLQMNTATLSRDPEWKARVKKDDGDDA